MQAGFESVDWDKVFSDKAVDDCYTTFLEVYNNLCEKYVPLRIARKPRLAPWLSPVAARLLRERDRLRNALVATGEGVEGSEIKLRRVSSER